MAVTGNPSDSGSSSPHAGESGDAAAAPRHLGTPASLTPRATFPGGFRAHGRRMAAVPPGVIATLCSERRMKRGEEGKRTRTPPALISLRESIPEILTVSPIPVSLYVLIPSHPDSVSV